MDEKLDLKDIIDISEDEFKKQISEWIGEHGISRKLQSKLRADLFEQFNRTKLGRKMSEQHQQAHRIVLSPLILVLNTLVAEFLYVEDCHFTLSVFASEVPYKNTLPDFENTTSGQLFRFSESELRDIFEAIGISTQNKNVVRDFYMKPKNSVNPLNKSLLYSIVKTLVKQTDDGRIERKSKTIGSKLKTSKDKATKVNIVTETSSSQQTSSPQFIQKENDKDSFRPKYERPNISSRYLKHLNRYLHFLSDRINDMAISLIQKHSGKKFRRSAFDSSSQEESIKKDLKNIMENINNFTKSKHQSKRFHDVLNSIERLSTSVEKFSGKLEGVLNTVHNTLNTNEQLEKKLLENKEDRLSNMDYGSWLKELKTSEHGKKFTDRLELSLQKAMEKERENLGKLYEEKYENYRMLIRLHYKQKYEGNKNQVLCRGDADNAEEKEISSPIDKFTPDNTERILASRALEKDQEIDDIVQKAKFRLQQLERESEELDQSFQAYIRRQQIVKQQMNNDASKIWQNYSQSKAALSEFDSNKPKRNAALIFNSKSNQILEMDQVFNSTLKDDVDIQEVLRDLKEIKLLNSPCFDRKETFLPLMIQKNEVGIKMVGQDTELPNLRSTPKLNAFHRDQMIGKKDKHVKTQIEIDSIENLEKTLAETYLNSSPVDSASKSQHPIENGNQIKDFKIQELITDPKTLACTTSEKNNKANEKMVESSVSKTPIRSKTIVTDHPDNALLKSTTSNFCEKIDEKKDIAIVSREDKVSVPCKVLLSQNKTIESTESNGKTFEKISQNVLGDFAVFTPVNSNGFINKKGKFVSKISDSDSNELISDQISIGLQQNKSSDDFWI